jgi:hypothetical protein
MTIRLHSIPHEGHSTNIPCISRDEERFPFGIRPDSSFIGSPDIKRPFVEESKLKVSFVTSSLTSTYTTG